ncbi:hypothetical protein J8F10_27210 [Gemmata sp. G18]|uniref:Uncharacterized protein n=1 Tax=Gemmata palustris TaxID=2822762 RepID=A0ABS5BZ07_9BACT|nr:hypothetical protein [Gemmata palustris]MBP3958949.1 hypothetical protein [Gemmata palustris]
MDEQLIALYRRHVATAFDRGLRLAALVEQKAGRAADDADDTDQTRAKSTCWLAPIGAEACSQG